MVDRREKLDEALDAFRHDLDTGHYPSSSAYITWLGQWNRKLADLATDYNREERIPTDPAAMSDLERSRFFRHNERLALLLTDYRYTHDPALFKEIVKILTETNVRKQADEDVAYEMENPNGVVKFAKDHLSPENYELVVSAGTDPIEGLSNAASLFYGLGTAGKVANATRRTLGETAKAVGKNTLKEAAIEGATEGFSAYVEDSRADVGSAARDGAIMGILMQGVSAAGGGALHGAKKGFKNIHEFHAELKQLNEQLESIGGNYDGMTEADLRGEPNPDPLDERKRQQDQKDPNPENGGNSNPPPHFPREKAFPELRKKRENFQNSLADNNPETIKTEAGYLYDEHTTALEERLALKDTKLVRTPDIDRPTYRRTEDGTIEVVVPDRIPADVAAKTPADIARYVEDTVRLAEFEPNFRNSIENQYAGKSREFERNLHQEHQKKLSKVESNLKALEEQLPAKEQLLNRSKTKLTEAENSLTEATTAAENGEEINLEAFQSAVEKAEETVAKDQSALERFQSTLKKKHAEFDELQNSEPPTVDPEALFEQHAGEEIDKVITSFTPAKKRPGNPDALHEVLLGLKQASQDALPDRPLNGDSLADLQSELTGRDGSEKTTILSRFVYEVSNLIVFGADSQGRATTQSPYHKAALAVTRSTSDNFPIRRIIQSTHAEMGAMDDAIRFEKGIGRYLDDPEFQNGSYQKDGEWGKRIIHELGIGMNSDSLYLRTEPQPVTIARPLNGGKPTVALPKNRSLGKDRKGAAQEMEAFMKRAIGIPPDGKLPEHLAKAIEHSEAISIWLLDPVDTNHLELDNADPNGPNGPVLAITTAGQYICGHCIGKKTSKSGAVEIAIAFGYRRIIFNSLPTNSGKAFQSKPFEHAAEVTAIVQKDGHSYTIETTRLKDDSTSQKETRDD